MLQTSFRTEKCEIFGWNCLLIAHSRPLTIIIIFRYSIYRYTEFLNKIFAHYQNNMELDEEEKIKSQLTLIPVTVFLGH
jgi:hypothetical protein